MERKSFSKLRPHGIEKNSERYRHSSRGFIPPLPLHPPTYRIGMISARRKKKKKQKKNKSRSSWRACGIEIKRVVPLSGNEGLESRRPTRFSSPSITSVVRNLLHEDFFSSERNFCKNINFKRGRQKYKNDNKIILSCIANVRKRSRSPVKIYLINNLYLRSIVCSPLHYAIVSSYFRLVGLALDDQTLTVTTVHSAPNYRVTTLLTLFGSLRRFPSLCISISFAPSVFLPREK